MDILVIGAGSWAKAVMDVVRRAGEHRVAGLLDNDAAPGDSVLDVAVVGRLEDLPEVAGRMGIRHGLIATSDIGARMETAQRIAALMPDFTFISAVDPAATLGSEVHCEAGTVIMAGARVEACTRIGEHCVIGSNASLGADSHLGSFVSVASGATIGEGCHVGSGSAIGINAGLVKRIVIGTHCVVGPGAMVMESVPDLHVAIGTPARTVRTRLVGEPYL